MYLPNPSAHDAYNKFYIKELEERADHEIWD